jgi:hypothetical protein
LPVKQVLEANLLRLVEEKWNAASSMVKPIFQHEFNLSVHFQIIRGIFLMEAGDIMHEFYTSLFQQVTSHVFVHELCVLSLNDFSKCVQEVLFIMCLLQNLQAQLTTIPFFTSCIPSEKVPQFIQEYASAVSLNRPFYVLSNSLSFH